MRTKIKILSRATIFNLGGLDVCQNNIKAGSVPVLS